MAGLTGKRKTETCLVNLNVKVNKIARPKGRRAILKAAAAPRKTTKQKEYSHHR
jgi:hypothetical protein